MVPVSSKLQNEMLLDLARNLRQERLLIGSERQNLQSLNKKVITHLLLYNIALKLFDTCSLLLYEQV